MDRILAVTDVHGKEITNIKTSWHEESGTYYMKFENNPDGIKVNISW